MNKKIIMIIICLFAGVFLLTGCTENFKHDAVAGDYTDKAVTSNGGMAVTYGKYLYFINGYAEETAENEFGEVLKGAIARVELDADGKPKKDTFTVIVPKKAYSTEKNYGGLFIYSDYIYYSTTSMDKNSEGEPKTAEMVIMRTKVDGTGTQVIAEFDSHSVPYKVVGDKLVYIKDQAVCRIDLAGKKFKAETVVEGVDTAYFFTKPENGNSAMDNYVFYSKTDASTSKKVIYAMSVNGDKNAAIIGSDMLGNEALLTPTIIEIKYKSDKLMIFFSIDDNRTNKPAAGLYSYTYDSSLSFDKAALVRYTSNPTSTKGFEYKSFYFAEDKILAFGSATNASDTAVSKIDVYSLEGEYEYNAITFSSTVTPYDFYLKDTDDGAAYYMYYNSADKLYNIKLFDITGEALVKAEGNAALCYSGAFSAQWISAEIINGTLYFFNSALSNNIFYLDLDAVMERDTETQKASLLGKMTDTDIISAL
ncbi:MAG: DUF5050 domain-containing protein [Clostridia bacterium]|nr:DUF5050 domain-containing protein [Clostridia bacterium]